MSFKLDIGCVERDEDRADFLAACGQLDLRAIRHLVDVKGVDVKIAADAIGQNCVHFVVCSAEHDAERQAQLLAYLASAGADVNAARTTDGWTPIFLAVIFGQTQLAMALLQNGAKLAVKDHGGMTPEDWADKYRMEQVKNLLVHSRSKVPHSRFTCVKRGPALEPVSPSSSTDESDTTPTSPPSSEATPSSSISNPIGESKESPEACLLTAQ